MLPTPWEFNIKFKRVGQHLSLYIRRDVAYHLWLDHKIQRGGQHLSLYIRRGKRKYFQKISRCNTLITLSKSIRITALVNKCLTPGFTFTFQFTRKILDKPQVILTMSKISSKNKAFAQSQSRVYFTRGSRRPQRTIFRGESRGPLEPGSELHS